MAKAAEKPEVKQEGFVLVNQVLKPHIFNVADGEGTIYLMPGQTSRKIAEEHINAEIRDAERQGEILVKKL